MVEGLGVHDYVTSGEGDLERVVAAGFTNGFNRLPQETSLVQWMRAYNADPKHARKIQFYGLDVSASEDGNTKAPLNGALAYLDQVDPKAAAALRAPISALLPRLNFSRFSDAPNHYTHLSQAERDRVTATIADMITIFKVNEASYTAATSERAYQRAYHTAIGARQVDDYVRRVPVGWTPKSGMVAVMGSVAMADRIKVDNLRWILQEQGANGKVLLFAHRDHLATALVTVNAPQPNPYHLPPVLPQPPMMGMYLPPLFGKNLVTIANLKGQDDSGCKAPRPPPSPSSLEGLLASLNTPFFLLDLRPAPSAVATWLRQSRTLYGIDFPDSLEVGRAFDIVFFSQRVTPAVPCSDTSAERSFRK
jgi:erythromycin esterase